MIISKILVTGSTGFIGSFLVERLESMGHIVSGLNTSNGDITDYDCVKAAVQDMDFVFHLASISGVADAERDVNESFDVIYNGTLNVVMACRSFDVKLIFASSRCVYGNSGYFPISEDIPLRPISNYGNFKMMAENLCTPNDFIVRLGAVYGPSDRCHSIVTRFIKKIKKREKIPIFNNLDVTRDFIYIDDVIDALILGIDNYGVYNVGSGVETSIQDLLDTISKVIRKKYKTVDMEQNIVNEINRVCLDINKIKINLGWEPKISLEDGIKRCKDV